MNPQIVRNMRVLSYFRYEIFSVERNIFRYFFTDWQTIALNVAKFSHE